MTDILLTSTFWLWAALAVTILCFLTGSLEYILTPQILRGYFSLFCSKKAGNEDGKINISDIAFFIGLPIFLATATNLNKIVTADVLDVICIVISILTAMLFSFMGLMQSKYESIKLRPDIAATDFEWYQGLQKQTFDIIAIETITSTLMLILCFVQPVIQENDRVIFSFTNSNVVISVQSIVGWFILWCFFFFIINVLMIIKRFYAFSVRK